MPDPRRVFVVHGRDDQARPSLWAFPRALDLHPLDWAAVVLMTPDDGGIGDLRPISDLAGIDTVHVDGTATSLQKIAQRLEGAG